MRNIVKYGETKKYLRDSISHVVQYFTNIYKHQKQFQVSHIIMLKYFKKFLV